MKNLNVLRWLLFVLAFVAVSAWGQNELRFARLDDFHLESGAYPFTGNRFIERKIANIAIVGLCQARTSLSQSFN